MKFLQQLFYILIFGFILLACKKSDKTNEELKTNLPNYSNIDLDKIFKRKDNQLDNKDSIISVIDQYYKNIWGNGDLWGGFLVAKGNKILYEKDTCFAQENNQ